MNKSKDDNLDKFKNSGEVKVREIEKDEYIYYAGCSDGWGSYKSQINGTCPECGGETVDGVAACGCNYSPVECKTCGSAPCNQSC